jgi:hypothetical protein
MATSHRIKKALYQVPPRYSDQFVTAKPIWSQTASEQNSQPHWSVEFLHVPNIGGKSHRTQRIRPNFTDTSPLPRNAKDQINQFLNQPLPSAITYALRRIGWVPIC